MDHTIEQAAELCGVTPYTLRYYEQAGVLPAIPRNSGGHRRYGEPEIGWVRFVQILKSTGMPLSEIREYVAAERLGDPGVDVRLGVLRHHKQRVEDKMRELQACVAKLDQKIGHYETRP